MPVEKMSSMEMVDHHDDAITVTEPDDQLTSVAYRATEDDVNGNDVSSGTSNATDARISMPEIQQLNKNRVKVLAERVDKVESKARKRLSSRKKRYCEVRHVSCKSDKLF